MPLDIDTFLNQLDSKLSVRPDGARLSSLLLPYQARLHEAELSGQSEAEVVAIYAEMRDALEEALKTPPGGVPPATPPSPPSVIPASGDVFDPFSDNLLVDELDLAGARSWLNDQYRKRLSTHIYFGFDRFKSIDGWSYAPPTPEDILAGMAPNKLQLIQIFPRPLLIMTPIGVLMRNLTTAFASKKGAMLENNPPINQWNWAFGASADFDHDIRGEMVYGVSRFDPVNHGGQTKLEVLNDPTNIRKGWQVLVVDGVEDVSGNTTDTGNGYVGLTPEDTIMLQAEGVRMGKPFDLKNLPYLPGAYLPSLDRIPRTCWSVINQQRLAFSSSAPDPLVDPNIGSRRAVRIL